LVLVSFANIIKNICREKGVAVRYGGDEFLIIKNFKQQDEVIKDAEGIYNSIHNAESFIPLIEKTLGRTIEISDDKRVSCSVGISFLDKQYGNKAFDIALKQADDALYFIKRSGKCRYEVWKPEMM
jgi:diguanylate cyclase (GGDEF)-like protein